MFAYFLELFASSINATNHYMQHVWKAIGYRVLGGAAAPVLSNDFVLFALLHPPQPPSLDCLNGWLSWVYFKIYGGPCPR